MIVAAVGFAQEPLIRCRPLRGRPAAEGSYDGTRRSGSLLGLKREKVMYPVLPGESLAAVLQLAGCCATAVVVAIGYLFTLHA